MPWCIGRGLESADLRRGGIMGRAVPHIKTVEGDRYTLSAGSLLGLSKGCILKVFASGDPNHAALESVMP